MSFFKRHYHLEIKSTVDNLRIQKISGSDWVHLDIINNGVFESGITIRDKEQLHQLHTAIGRVLSED